MYVAEVSGPILSSARYAACNISPVERHILLFWPPSSYPVSGKVFFVIIVNYDGAFLRQGCRSVQIPESGEPNMKHSLLKSLHVTIGSNNCHQVAMSVNP